MRSLDWSDLQYILAIARNGSLTAAARALGVNHSTVLRRINSFEDVNKVRLFDRQRSGYKLTPEGAELLEAAQEVELVVTNLERKIAGTDDRLEGAIRVTTTDSFLFYLVGPHLTAFQDKYPGIKLEIVATNHVVSLSKRDADVAIRPSPNQPSALTGTRICDINCALYASRDYWAANKHRAMDDQRWLGLSGPMSETLPARWMAKHVPEDRIVLTVDTFMGVYQAACDGAGISVLPCFIGGEGDELVRLGDVIEPCRNGLWVLTHKDLMNTARYRTFVDYMAESLKREEPRLLGIDTPHAPLRIVN